MKSGRIIAVMLVSIVVSACQANYRIDGNDPKKVVAKLKTERDEFKKQTRFTGPNTASEDYDLLMLRATKADATGAVSYQIYIADYYSGEWRFYNSTYDSNGAKLETIVISRDVTGCDRTGCGHKEHLAIPVTLKYLEESTSSGIRFKISGKAGEEVFFLPGPYIQTFLSVAK